MTIIFISFNYFSDFTETPVVSENYKTAPVISKNYKPVSMTFNSKQEKWE